MTFTDLSCTHRPLNSGDLASDRASPPRYRQLAALIDDAIANGRLAGGTDPCVNRR